LWLHSLKVAQLLRSAACLHTNQSRSYLNHLVQSLVGVVILPVWRVLNRGGMELCMKHGGVNITQRDSVVIYICALVG